MAVSQAVLDLPIPDATRRVVRAQVACWDLEAQRLTAGLEGEALHDYRTAVRRLRTLLRVFRPWLPHLPESAPRRLRRLMRLTGPSRNLEVMIAWIGHHRAGLTSRHRVGARWLTHRLEARLAHHNRTMAARWAERDARLRDRISRGLGRPTRRYGSGIPRTDLVLRRLVRRETGVLDDRLDAIGSLGGSAEIHSARIAAKRVRYLLEPFVEELEAAADPIEPLRTLQDLLGSLTDAHVMARELREAMLVSNTGRAERLGRQLLGELGQPPADATVSAPPVGAQAGLAALARALRREGEESYQQFQAWSAGPRKELFEVLGRVGAVNRGGRI